MKVKMVGKKSARCKNVYSNCVCNYYKLVDHCVLPAYKAWMFKHCAATCGVCTADSMAKVCRNTYPDQMCTMFASLGFHKQSKMQYFMACKCPKVCGICDMDTPPSAPSIIDNTLDQEECLRLHNEKRSLHGAAELTWCTKCAAFAQTVVQTLQDSDSPLIHSSTDQLVWRVNGKIVIHGENLMYHFPEVDCQMSVESWYREKDLYNPRNPLFDIESSSHFTQMVWKDTQSVGCAKTQSYLACIYEPAGNMRSIYLFRMNVQV
ncbi:ectin-like isoform X2 [Branchiostoma floridae]|nr:ectin-like isoform X2 [Branchiostoma floridae]